jgi:hypothetical protein
VKNVGATRPSCGVLPQLDSAAAAAVLFALNRAGGNASVQRLVRQPDHRARLAGGHFQSFVQRRPPNKVTPGKIAHKGPVGKGRKVEVRTGEKVALSSGKKIPNMIALDYTGAEAEKSKWLQFVLFELVATAPDKSPKVANRVTAPLAHAPRPTSRLALLPMYSSSR